MNKKFILINTQIALFFKEKIERPDLLYNDLNLQIGGLFVLPPMVVPIPNEFQLDEIPMVQLKSRDNTYNLNIAKKRADFFISGEGEQQFSDKKEIFIEKAKIFFNFFSQHTEVKRIGFVSRFFVEDENKETIKSVFVKKFIDLHSEDPKKNEVETTDAYARYSTKIVSDGVKINNYSSIEKQQVIISNVKKTGLVITRDFNTDPSEDYSNKINADFLSEFISKNSEKFNLSGFEDLLWPTK